MKNQLLELFGKTLFRFHFRHEGIIDYRSVVPVEMDGMYCDIKVEFFDNSEGEDALFAYETFEDISEKYKIFEIVKLPIIINDQREVLFHQKYDEDEFY